MSRLSDCQKTNETLRTRITTLEAKLAACEAKLVPIPTPTPTPTPTPITNIKGIATPGDLQNWSVTDRQRYINLMKAAGATWIRVSFDIGWSQGGITLARQAKASGLKVLGVIFDNRRIIPAKTTIASFATSIVNEADAFEIWNEQNIPEFWPNPDPIFYASLYNAAKIAIKSKRNVPVVSGGLSPSPDTTTRIDPATFLTRALNAGMLPDAIGWHPYCLPNLPGQDAAWSTWTKMKTHSTWGKYPVWLTEFGASTYIGSGLANPEGFQAQSITEVFRLWKQYNINTPIFIYEGRDGGTDAYNDQHRYGMLHYDWSRKPGYDAYKAVI